MPMKKGQKAPRKINLQQRIFAEQYVQSGKVDESYLRAYPETTNKASASASGSRLLKDAKVQEYIRQLRQESMDRTGLTLDWATQQMRTLYNAAMDSEDWNAAGNALNMIMKHLGGYEIHNKQKLNYTQEDVERLKNELKEKGFNLDRLNDRSAN